MTLLTGGAGVACQYSTGSVQTGELKTEFLRGGKGAPLLYMHGLGRWSTWDSDHIGLALRRSVYAPILPGWKAKQLPAPISSVRDYAPLMLAFMDAEGIERADIIAHSIGGWVALHIALMAPDRISRLVLVNAMGLDEPTAPASDISALDEAGLYNAAFAAKSGMMVAAGDFGGVPLDLRGGEMFRHIVHGQQNLIRLSGGKCGEPGLAAQIEAIIKPTLLIWGEDDKIVPIAHGAEFRARVSGSRLVTIAEAGHCPQKETPHTFVRVVTNFLLDREEEVTGASRESGVRAGGGGITLATSS